MKDKLWARLKNTNRYHVLILVTMLLSAFLLIYLTTIKEGMHVDEYLTYGLANHEEDGNNKITPEYGIRLNATDVYDTFFYADDFSLRNVWMNQGIDVHPPLFYLCIHIFTLITHHFMALKTGILVNIIFHIINIGLVWMILKELLSDENEALLGAVLYAFLPSVLGNVLFIRMYVMLSLFILCLTLLFVKGWDKSDKKAFYIKLGIISVAGTLTHYYFLIYLFFCCMVWGIYILVRRRWKELAVFLVTMAVSAGVSIAVFPYMLEHIFSSYRGEESLGNLLSASAFSKNIKAFWTVIDNLYGGFLLAVIIAALLVVLFMKYLVPKADIKDKCESPIKWLLIFLPCLFYMLAISRIAVSSATRYITPIYAVCIILLMGLFKKAAAYIASDGLRCVAAILMVCVLLNNSYQTYTWPELYTEDGENIKWARKYGINNDCIYVMNLSWHSFTAYQEFIQYQSMTFIRDNNLDLLYTEDYSDYDHVVMYFDKAVGEEDIEGILEEMIARNPGLDSYEKMHEWYYNVTYYLD